MSDRVEPRVTVVGGNYSAHPAAVSARKRREEVRRAGLCIKCRQPSAKSTCEDCTEARRPYGRAYYVEKTVADKARRREGGLCLICEEIAFHASAYCERHWITDIGRRYGVKGAAVWALYDRLRSAGFRCFYTGWRIIPGESASLDHLEPRRGAEDKSGRLENLVWAHKDINRMKGERTLSEFVGLCRLIADRSPLTPVEGAFAPDEAGTGSASVEQTREGGRRKIERETPNV